MQRFLGLVGVLMFVLFAVGCGQSSDTSTSEGSAKATDDGSPDSSTPVIDTQDGMQTIADARRARESMPGKAHYQAVCANCHEGGVEKAPHREMIGLMTPEAILDTLTDGLMQAQAAGLTDPQRIEVAEYLGGRKLGESVTAVIPRCDDTVQLDLNRPPVTANWGLQPTNTRNTPAEIAGLSAEDLPKLKPLWALNFPGANRVRSQPTMAGGLIFVGSHGGEIYALDQKTGCAVWTYETAAEVRTGIALDAWQAGDKKARPRIYFGDVLGNVYAVDGTSGRELWRQRADDHPNATITGTPSLHDGRLFVPVSSLEVSLAVDPTYECCTFRGSVVAYDAASGKQIWKTYTIEEPASVQSQNSAGTDMRGPSGATVWNSPSIDVERNQLYIGTGENMSSPATLTSDAIFAMDLDTGKVAWTFQATANDVWNTACDTDTPQSCPPEMGPDFDFGSATMLLSTSTGTDLVIGGQKSGLVHALDPDTGTLVWQTRVGRGGIQGGVHFGMAAADGQLFVPITDMADGRTYDNPARPGVHALDADTGKIRWYEPSPDVCDGRDFCHPGISQAITAVNGMVFAGGMDGVMRVHDQASGEVLLALDTTGRFDAVTGEQAFGGSFGGGSGPVVQDGLVLLSSGYGIYNHMPGNMLLVLGVEP